MQIELDIFSGLQNPVWSLAEADASVLLRLHGALAASKARPPMLPGLGYRGFCYQVLGDPFRAYGGSVCSAALVLADENLSVERFLSGKLPPEYAHLRNKVSWPAALN